MHPFRIVIAALFFLITPFIASASGDRLVRCPDFSSVYRVEDDGKRHAFPNEAMYFSWVQDFSSVEMIDCPALAEYMLGGNVTYQAGTRLVKIPSVPIVYAVEPEGVLREVPSESYAKTVWGADWAKRVDDLAEGFFNSYEVGDALGENELPEGTVVIDNGVYSRVLDGELAQMSDTFLRSFAIAYDPVRDFSLESAGRIYPDGYYTGPLWDTHIHMPGIPEGPIEDEDLQDVDENDRPMFDVNVSIKDMMETFDAEGTEKIFGFFGIWKELAPSMTAYAEDIINEYADQIVPFIMPPDNDEDPDGSPTVDAETLEEMLSLAPGLFAGYGEIGLYARTNGGADELPPDDPRLLEIYPIVQDHQLLVYVHLGEGHQDNFERALDLFPDVTFIFHGDQLIPTRDNQQDLSAIEEILDNHDNVYYGIDELYGNVFLLREDTTREEFFAHFEEYEPLLEYDLDVWSDFINRHQDQVLWGTDRGWSTVWTLHADVGFQLTDYARAFIGLLDPVAQEKFAYKNAQGLVEY